MAILLDELKMNQVLPQQQQAGSALLYDAAGQPVAITLPTQTVDYELYKSGQSKTAGVILIITGILSIALNGIGIGLREEGTFTGHGIWCGVLVSKLCLKLYLFCIIILVFIGLVYGSKLPLCADTQIRNYSLTHLLGLSSIKTLN